MVAGGRWRAVGDAVRRARTSLGLVEQLDLVGRTGETARAFGTQSLMLAFSVLEMHLVVLVMIPPQDLFEKLNFH